MGEATPKLEGRGPWRLENVPHCPPMVGWGRKFCPPSPPTQGHPPDTGSGGVQPRRPCSPCAERPGHFKGRVLRGFRALGPPGAWGWGAPAIPRGLSLHAPCPALHHLPSPHAPATPQACVGQEGGLGETRKCLGACESYSLNVQVEPSVASERDHWKLLEGCTAGTVAGAGWEL